MLISTLLSMILHGIVVTVFVIGIPLYKRDLKDLEPLVFITVVDELPETNQPTPSAKSATKSDEIKVSSKTPPSPSLPSPAQTIPSPTAELPENVKKRDDSKENEILPMNESVEKPTILLPKTHLKIDSEELPISKPKSPPKKVEIASPVERPEIPKLQKKPVSRPEKKPQKKELPKTQVASSDLSKIKSKPNINTRDMIKSIIKNKPTPKTKNQINKDNLLAKETPAKNINNTMSAIQNLAQNSVALNDKSPSKAPEQSRESMDAEEINSELESSAKFKSNPSARLGAALEHRIASHLSLCWTLPAGAPNVQNLRVELQIQSDKNGKVEAVQLKNSKRYKEDSLYRVAANAAIRAVKQCNMPPLPPEKYDSWKNLPINFTPPSSIGG